MPGRRTRCGRRARWLDIAAWFSRHRRGRRTARHASHRNALYASSVTAVYRFDLAGNALTPTAAYRPVGLAIAPDGGLYVADSQKGRLWKISYGGR